MSKTATMEYHSFLHVWTPALSAHQRACHTCPRTATAELPQFSAQSNPKNLSLYNKFRGNKFVQELDPRKKRMFSSMICGTMPRSAPRRKSEPRGPVVAQQQACQRPCPRIARSVHCLGYPLTCTITGKSTTLSRTAQNCAIWTITKTAQQRAVNNLVHERHLGDIHGLQHSFCTVGKRLCITGLSRALSRK